STEEWEYQFAWDKQEKFIKSQSSAMKTLNSMVKDYEELLHKNWDLATEEQKLRIEVLKEKLNKDDTSGINNRVQIVDDIDG
ncbi:MAG: terminase, partial [Clostridium celatum]|nr:terminase [Clostridium celatum]